MLSSDPDLLMTSDGSSRLPTHDEAKEAPSEPSLVLRVQQTLEDEKQPWRVLAGSPDSAEQKELWHDPWALELQLASGCGSSAAAACTLRPLREGDEDLMSRFGLRGLGPASRETYAPFPWDDPGGLAAALRAAIGNHLQRRDLHYLVVDDQSKEVVAQVFLWSVTDEVPELGLAVADAWQGRGLGCVLLKVMEKAARALQRAALELTTMQHNERAFRLYHRAGYELLGLIRNPLGVDVTAAFAREVVATKFCDERHMVRVLVESRRSWVLQAMSDKRQRAVEIFGSPECVV